jgi:predicted glycogen debranching enzyme
VAIEMGGRLAMTAVERPGVPELRWTPRDPVDTDDVLRHEWLITNALGGYASGTVAFCNTRRCHGLFVPALAGKGRTVMLGRLEEEVRVGESVHRLSGAEHPDGLELPGLALLRDFRLEGLLPTWEYAFGEARLRRTLAMVHGENTVFAVYRHLAGPPLRLRLRPYPTFRPHDSGPDGVEPRPVPVRLLEFQVEMQPSPEATTLRMRMHGNCEPVFVGLPAVSGPLVYRVDHARGYAHVDQLTSPGYFEGTLQPGESLALGATVEGWDRLERDPTDALALELERERRLLERADEAAWKRPAARFVLAADQFIIAPRNRPADEAWARATGQDARSVIAGYPWFTDWGRDTMISLEGLTLCTGRAREAAAILRTFRHYLKDGLVPNYFPEGKDAGVYHTADASLWYFHALQRYLEHTGDAGLLRELWPALVDIVQRHQQGTLFHIRVDPRDGLLSQGVDDFQLTWMDAKVDGWVVTPRRGKAVEINALWFNALALMGDWARELDQDAGPYRAAAERAGAAFNRRFWNPATGCLFDVVDGPEGDDPKIRPNQIFAISLTHPVLDPGRWEPVLRVAQELLYTPVGLRTLSPHDPDFKPTYDGDLRARDAAYHQGTVWPWLLGHYVDAWLKLRPERMLAREMVQGLENELSEACLGQVSEIFDATPPFHPRGCFAQAWSVAEALRVWLATG